MCRCRHHVDILLFHIDWKVSNCLYGICMEIYTFFFTDCTDLSDWLNASNLVICIHNGHKTCVRANSCLKFIQANHTIFMDIQICYFVTFFFQFLQCMKYCVMLESCRNNVFFISACTPFCRRYDSLIVSLASTGSEINLIRLCSDTGSNLLSCFLQYFLGLLSRSMKT